MGKDSKRQDNAQKQEKDREYDKKQKKIRKEKKKDQSQVSEIQDKPKPSNKKKNFVKPINRGNNCIFFNSKEHSNLYTFDNNEIASKFIQAFQDQEPMEDEVSELVQRFLNENGADLDLRSQKRQKGHFWLTVKDWQGKARVYYAKDTTQAQKRCDIDFPRPAQQPSQGNSGSSLLLNLASPCPDCTAAIEKHISQSAKDDKSKNKKPPTVGETRTRWQLLAPCQNCTANFLKRLNLIFTTPKNIFKPVAGNQEIYKWCLQWLSGHASTVLFSKLTDETIRQMCKTSLTTPFIVYFEKHQSTYRVTVELKSVLSYCKNGDINTKFIMRFPYNTGTKQLVHQQSYVQRLVQANLGRNVISKFWDGSSIDKNAYQAQILGIKAFYSQFAAFVFGGWPAPDVKKKDIQQVTSVGGVPQVFDISAIFSEKPQVPVPVPSPQNPPGTSNP